MKALVVGDQHFKLDLSYADYIPDRREAEKRAVFETIHKAAEDCEIVVLLGDNLHARHNHSSVIKAFVDFLLGFGDKELHIISGNHEVYDGSSTALDFLREIGLSQKWNIYTRPEHSYLGGRQVTFLPYQTNAALGANSFEEAREKILEAVTHPNKDVLFHHHTVSGMKTLGGMTDLFNEAVLPREKLEETYKLILGGHIHQPSQVGNTHIVGSLFTADMGETEKRVVKLDLETLEVESIPLPVRQLLKTSSVEELSKFPDNAIVKFTALDKTQDIDSIKELLRRFDAFILVEDYPSERKKVHIDDGATEDFSTENLLRLYAKEKNVDEDALLSAFELVR